MEKITLKIRTTKTSGEIRLRFRLLDGRRADLTHKSDIKASLKDLEKFNPDGKLKDKIKIYNKDLLSSISEEMDLMRQAYHRMKAERIPVNGVNFENLIEEIKHPAIVDTPEETLLGRFERFIEEAYEEGRFQEHRKRQYMVTYRTLKRYLSIMGQTNILPLEIKGEDIIRFGMFIEDEYRYASQKKWDWVYKDTKKRDIPTAPRKQNTKSTALKMLRALFNELVAGEEVSKSPFTTTGRKRIQELMASHKDHPISLTAEEFAGLLNNTDIPDNLKSIYDTFIVHCALGCRIGDFQKLSMSNICVSPEGIPFVRYMPEKTKRQSRTNEEIHTPLMKFAFEIIKRNNFNFPMLRYASGKSGYNALLKKLLKHCGINREVPVFNPIENCNDMLPLHEVASSKLARKTLVDMLHKVQLDIYAAGLHAIGSSAVTHYTRLGLKDRFLLMNIAFKQPDYRVNPDLSIMESIKS